MHELNLFELHTREVEVDGSDGHRWVNFSEATEGLRLFEVQLWIDGVHVEPELVIDLTEVLESVKRPSAVRGSYIFNCGCGVPGCAGIEEGVSVSHHKGLVAWDFLSPVSRKKRGTNFPDDERISYRFSQPAMMAQCRKLVTEIRFLSGNSLDTCRVPLGERPLEKLFCRSRFKWARSAS